MSLKLIRGGLPDHVVLTRSLEKLAKRLQDNPSQAGDEELIFAARVLNIKAEQVGTNISDAEADKIVDLCGRITQEIKARMPVTADDIPWGTGA